MRWNSSKRSWAEAGAFVFAAIILAGCAAKPLADTAPWSTHLFSDSRSNLSPAEVSLPLAVSWEKDVSDFRLLRPFPKEQLSSPALHGGILYVGSTNDRFYAVDLSTGSVKWRYHARQPIEASPAITGEMVCFGSADGVMRCLDHSGKVLWEYQARSEILSSPVVSGGRLFFNSQDDRVHALNAMTGVREWTYSRATYTVVSPRIYGSPAYSGDGSLFFLFSDGNIVSLDAETGSETWSKKVIGSFVKAGKWRRSPLYQDGTVYVIDGNEAVQALDAATGEVKGVYGIIKTRDFIIPDRRSIVLVGETDIVALDRLSGAILWKKKLSTGATSSVFAAGEELFVLSSFKKAFLGLGFLSRDKGHIEAISLRDGSTSWTTTLGSDVTANASSAYSRVALLTNKGKLTVFEPK
ncbi:MAG: PQQ-binding-like beta-propeller repeat protein [Deltaproteobacteria bacterium]|nr:PQQ-binding-like beta-propeller repeat protein [Deltaproteobacteria bacterium]MBZ0219061.1 PQQ-binding-like beta-propeller repeat protein [Deltaproteobacteria bacterium]